jgi:hypothetical protein
MIITVTLDRFESSQAILILDSGEKIIWPKHKLPAEIKEGQSFRLKISLDPQTTEKKENIAKQFLNEILEN